MSTYEEKKALREQGLTYRQIADILGCSTQAVSYTLSKYNPNHFRLIQVNGCKFPNLVKWMNDNKVGYKELTIRMGYIPNSNMARKIADRVRGKSEINKKDIDKILSVTGLSYEEAFMEKNGGSINEEVV